ncbi:MAG: hypothetical protein ACR2F1_03475 [Nitrososphaeraceae archaeon]
MIKNNLTLALFPIISMLIIITSFTIIATAYAQEELNVTERPKFLAIQHAQSGSISELNKTFTLTLTNESNKAILSSDTVRTFTLELNNVSDKTILFSDRPDRIVTSLRTADFIGNWSIGEYSFAVDAPNAALVIDKIEEQDVITIELFNPVYDIDKKKLKYEVSPNNATSIDLPREFEQTTLVIDGEEQKVVFDIIQGNTDRQK